MTKARRNWLAIACVLAMMVLFSSASQAVVTGRIGGGSDRQYFAAEDAAWTTTSTTWVNVPGSWGTLTISGPGHMLDARFTAESLCDGASWCSVRITVQNTTSGWWQELYPVSGSDFAFDSPGGSWESHAVERFTDFLPAAMYAVRVQALVSGGGSFRLDDRTLAVSAIVP